MPFLSRPDSACLQPGSIPFALSTAAADGAVRNLISDFAASAFALALDAAAEAAALRLRRPGG